MRVMNLVLLIMQANFLPEALFVDVYSFADVYSWPLVDVYSFVDVYSWPLVDVYSFVDAYSWPLVDVYSFSSSLTRKICHNISSSTKCFGLIGSSLLLDDHTSFYTFPFTWLSLIFMVLYKLARLKVKLTFQV